KKERIDPAEYDILNKFSYETRYSARDFCSFLIDFNPSFTSALSEDIVDQAWFPLDWKKDPTISSMLVVLNAIQVKFEDTQDIWTKLKQGAISFYFLPIKDMGLTDELYIKMNSRGKPLTPFEHFKAELERELCKIDEKMSKHIISKIDIDWTDMLWRYRSDDNIIDDEFLRYFNFICDIICYQSGGTTQDKSNDEFELLKEYFSSDSENVMEHIQILEDYFDCWCFPQDENTPDEFFEKFISHKHEAGKIKVENRYKINVFKDCVSNYGERQFTLGRIILLYAVITYRLNKNTITEGEFTRRLRILNNLILNSEDQISDSELRSSGNRMPAILKQVDDIITSGSTDQTAKNGLNSFQLEEEAEKNAWVKKNPDQAAALYELEDHDLLHGQIGIVGLDNPKHFLRFKSLFSCDRDLVDCALMSIGNYGQEEGNRWRYQFGTKENRNLSAWRDLFHKSNNKGFDETQRILRDLLSRTDTFTDELLSNIIIEYINNCETNNEYEWRYYYVKYDIFRPGKFGKFRWDDFENRPYELIILVTRSETSSYSYQPFLKAICEDKLSKDHAGRRLIDGNNYYDCENAAYLVRIIETDEIIDKIAITQNDKGIDTEDRIQKFREYWENRSTRKYRIIRNIGGETKFCGDVCIMSAE
ncbi:MAG: DUF262 domain-containing protein, partial [Chloroflexi bacterium]|nr:DUF262 domain-containing protein [Chloroflexota bacterium]